jgi:hypothetical protein
MICRIEGFGFREAARNGKQIFQTQRPPRMRGDRLDSSSRSAENFSRLASPDPATVSRNVIKGCEIIERGHRGSFAGFRLEAGGAAIVARFQRIEEIGAM